MTVSDALKFPVPDVNSPLQFRLVPKVKVFSERVAESYRFSVGDRIRAHSWITRASALGYGKLVFASDDDSTAVEPCEYMLIYRRDIQWAQWGIACGRDGYEVWHATRGTTLGVYPQLAEAFEQILAQPA